MNILILNRLSYKRAPYEHFLDESNNIYLLCDQVRKSDYEDKNGYRNKIFFQDWRLNGLIEKEASVIHNKDKIDVIIALSESDIERAANLREQLNVPGQSYQSALAFRDKIVMKEILSDSGIRVPKFKKVSHPIDIIEFSEILGFPFVIKPIDGAGSSNTFIIKSKEELDSFLATNSNLTWDMEEFIDGDMYHVDGFIKDGEIIMSQPSKYINGCLAFKENKYLGSVVLTDDNKFTQELNKFNKKVLSALPTPNVTSFHTEIFITKDDELVFCETACRTGGARVHDTIKYQVGFDLFECSIKELCGVNYKPLYRNKEYVYGWALIPPKRGRLLEFPNSCDLPFVQDFDTTAKINQDYSDPSRSVDSFISYIVNGKSESEVEYNLNKVAEWIDKNSKWDI